MIPSIYTTTSIVLSVGFLCLLYRARKKAITIINKEQMVLLHNKIIDKDTLFQILIELRFRFLSLIFFLSKKEHNHLINKKELIIQHEQNVCVIFGFDHICYLKSLEFYENDQKINDAFVKSYGMMMKNKERIDVHNFGHLENDRIETLEKEDLFDFLFYYYKAKSQSFLSYIKKNKVSGFRMNLYSNTVLSFLRYSLNYREKIKYLNRFFSDFECTPEVLLAFELKTYKCRSNDPKFDRNIQKLNDLFSKMMNTIIFSTDEMDFLVIEQNFENIKLI